MKGGSKASDLVMETQPKLCDDPQSVVNVGTPIEGDVKQMSLYQTTGGGKKSRRKSNNKRKSKSKSKSKSKPKRRKSQRRKHFKCSNCGHLQGGQRHGGVADNCLGVSNSQKGGSDWRSTLYSRGPVNQPNMNPDQFRMFTQNAEYMPNDTLRSASFLKGGGRKNKRGKKSKKKINQNLNLIRSDRPHYMTGGSDWKSTLYSRGPVNQPNMNPDHFRMFTQNGNYIPNTDLRNPAFMK